MTQATTNLNMRSKNLGAGYMPLKQAEGKAISWTLLDDVIESVEKCTCT
jgi:hypothetical protein